MLSKCIFVYKTHFDIGFTKLPSEILDYYCHDMLDGLIKTCEECERLDPAHPYVWTTPSWPVSYILNSGNQNIRRLLKNGLISVHNMPFTIHTEFSGLEELIRSMSIAKRISDIYGHRSISAKMTDVPGHTRILPSLLYGAGVRFLHLGCNPCATPPDVPQLFFWQGPDGKSILTFYSKGGYGSDPHPPKNWPYPVWLCLSHTNDNTGAHNAQTVTRSLRQAKIDFPEAEIVCGTLDDFYFAISQCDLSNVPVIKGDLADSWIHGVGSYPKEVRGLRELRPLVIALETAYTLEVMNGRRADDEFIAGMSRIYENLSLFDEHTWGLDMKMVPSGYAYTRELLDEYRKSGKYDRLTASWEEKRDYFRRAATEYSALCDRENAATLTQCRLGDKLTVFNNHAWITEGWAQIAPGGALADSDAKSYKSVDFGDVAYAWVPPIPGLGGAAFTVVKSDKGESRDYIRYDGDYAVMENKCLAVWVNRKTGEISRFVNKRDGRNWAGEGGLFTYRYTVYGRRDIARYLKDYSYDFEDWSIRDFGKYGYPAREKECFDAQFISLDADSRSHGARLRLNFRSDAKSADQYGNARKIVLELTLLDDEDELRVVWRLVDKQPTMLLESGNFILRLPLTEPRFRVGKLGGAIDPSGDIVKDANHALYCCDGWFDISDSQGGCQVIPVSAPLVSFGMDATLRFDETYVPTESVAFMQAFNNQWGTNFPQWIEGDLIYSYRVRPYKGVCGDDEMDKRARNVEKTTILRGCRVLPELEDSLGEAVEILALKPAWDGRGFILRLRETSGKSRHIKPPAIGEFQATARTNLIEEDEAEIAPNSYIEISGYEIVTLRLVK